MLQAGMSIARFPMRSLDIFNLPDRSSRELSLELTQSLTEMNAMYLPGVTEWPACKAGNFTSIREPIFYKI
jgi:hypothetical protein